MYRIAIITSKVLQSFFSEALEVQLKKHKIDFYIHEELVKTCEIYAEIEKKYDGFLTSGEIVTNAIEKYVINVRKPILSISSDLVSYYETFFKLIYKTRNISFDRIYIDFLDWSGGDTISNYLSNGTFGTLLYGFRKSLSELSLAQIIAMDRNITQKHVELWKNKKIDISITRSSNILSTLDKEKVNYIFVKPDKYHAIEAFDRLINEITLKKFHENSSAVIFSKLDKKCDSEKIIEAISAFKTKFLSKLLINFFNGEIEILTTRKDIMILTNEMKECNLGQFILDRTGYRIGIGYGIGDTTYEALRNSKIAFQETQNYRMPASFILNNDENMIGPLNSEKLVIVNMEVSSHIKEMAQKSGLSTLTIQKVLAVKKKLDKNEITVAKLSDYLGITIRNANRILSKLLEANEVVLLYTQQFNTKGRPKKVFSILLEKD